MNNCITPFQGLSHLFGIDPGATCFASLRTWPWLSYLALLALPLAFISRAFDAAIHET
jgi:hypothetical protein